MKHRLLALVATVATGLVLSNCGSNPDSSSGSDATATSKTSAIPTQQLNSSLRSQLPQSILSAGTITSVNYGSAPPYNIVAGNGTVTGASRDFEDALEQMLDVKIQNKTVGNIAAVITGIQAGRFDLSVGPIGDYTTRQQQVTFVDWMQDHVVFAVQQGNPRQITGLSATCGTKVAALAASSTISVLNKQLSVCASQGKDAVQIQEYPDSPTAVLAVQSGRADAFFSSQARLTYYVNQSKGALELAGTGEDNGFGIDLQGAATPKDGALAQVLLKAFQTMQSNGTYDAIMKKWGLEASELKTLGINVSKKAN
jgi:polar amino acid transport system substrate-binding protein